MRTVPWTPRCGGSARLVDQPVEAPQEGGERLAAIPVGAWISVCRPWLIAAQPAAWAGVGASNVASNQARTAGPNGARGSSMCATTGRRV